MMELPLNQANDLRLPNPYSNRGPVTNPLLFYGRGEQVLKVVESLMLWQPFAISGEPGIGKTSFLYYLVHPEGARKLHEFKQYVGEPSTYLFVLIELQRLPVRNAIGFWRYMLDRLLEEANKQESMPQEALEACSSIMKGIDSGDQYQLQIGFENCLKLLRKKVVFLFDDFDILIEGFQKTEVIQLTENLRALKQALDLGVWLNYIVVSTAPLTDLFAKQSIVSISPFPNIFLPNAPFGLLEKDAADKLICEPLQHIEPELQFTDRDVAFIYQLAGRYPDFIKITCYYLFAAYVQKDITYPAVRQKIADDASIDLLMNRLWERLKQDEELEGLPLTKILLQVAQRLQPENVVAYKELRHRGLVEEIASSPSVFSDLFRTFILKKNLQSPSSASSTTSSPFELTQKESILYTYLAEHIGQVCSREQLRAAIWGNEFPKSSDALEQLVKRVRSKIEPNREQPLYLVSIRGQGYMLRSEPTRERQ